MKPRRTFLISLPALAGILFAGMSGCSSYPSHVSIGTPVGPPGPKGDLGSGSGHLIVYSAFEVFLVGDPSYPHHTNYSICDKNGNLLKRVENQYTPYDPSPVNTELLAGNYNLRARAVHFGEITVPIVVRPGKLTVVYLDDVPHSDVADVASDQLVVLPDGQKVGWRATP